MATCSSSIGSTVGCAGWMAAPGSSPRWRATARGARRETAVRGPSAGLVEPNGVALSRDGRTLFIADVAGHRIRSVDLPTGRIATFAGTGKPRHEGDGGPASKAAIAGARAVDVGPDGSVYILEREGNSLRVVRPDTGTITTIAGTGARGYSGDGGPATSATFNGPKELAVDAAGNVWIVDTENHAIRVIDAATHRIRTAAGNGRRGGDGDGGPPTSAAARQAARRRRRPGRHLLDRGYPQPPHPAGLARVLRRSL